MDSTTGSRKLTGFRFAGTLISPGEKREIYLKVSESFLATAMAVPVTVLHGVEPGPVGFVTAAVHGDEINGTDIVRRLILELDPKQLKGTVIAVPVVNIPGFLEQSRYLPYHRDLNRFFPGKRKGNNAERIAHKVFKEIVQKCDFGIDLHTASHGRLNLPHIRGDLGKARVRELARAFGSTVIVNSAGLEGSLRKSATDSGAATILFEAGETGKFSRSVSLAGLRGVLSVLEEMGMWKISEKGRKRPPFQVIVQQSEWIRTEMGGILDLAIRPGDLVYEDDIIGEILNPFGRTVTEIHAPVTGIVLGISRAPLTIPGAGVVHIARLKKTLAHVERSVRTTTRSRARKRAKAGKRTQ
jgi:predicted deacylase